MRTVVHVVVRPRSVVRPERWRALRRALPRGSRLRIDPAGTGTAVLRHAAGDPDDSGPEAFDVVREAVRSVWPEGGVDLPGWFAHRVGLLGWRGEVVSGSTGQSDRPGTHPSSP